MTAGPASAGEEFFAALGELRQAASEVSYATLVRQAAAQRPPLTISGQRLSDWFGGKAVPTDPAVVRFLVTYLQAKVPRDSDYHPRRLPWWLNRHQVASQQRQTGRASDGPSAASARPSRRLGLPVDDCDPLTLEVHRAIQVPGTGTGLLPGYVSRAHDALLREAADRMLESGASQLVTVVGGSSTGKTRACWELARYLDQQQPSRWRVWHPYDPTRPEGALADLQQAGDHTVVWLNEAQHYLMPTDPVLGERLAAGLRTLLTDEGRAPVIVLATLWPAYWDTLTVRPGAGQPDPYAQARDLLARGTKVTVGETFTPAELAGLRGAGVDARLRYADGHADGGRITQYLAGAPALEDRYRTAPPAVQAILHVAMDARWLGHPPALPYALLEQAAPGYLTEHEWDHPGGDQHDWDDDWLEQALAYATARLTGAHGPLTRIRHRPARPAPAGGPHYRLADYLDQLGRSERPGVWPPESLWTACTVTVTVPDVLRHLGKQAEDRGRFQHAIRLYVQAADRGDTDARRALARLREQAGAAPAEVLDRLARRDTSVAGPEYVPSATEVALDQQAADRVSLGTSALHDLAARQEQAGDTDGAEASYRQAAERGDTSALCALSWLREQAGDAEGAKAFAVQAAERDDTSALHGLAMQRAAAGNSVDTEALAVLAADYGNTEMLWTLAVWRAQAAWRSAASSSTAGPWPFLPHPHWAEPSGGDAEAAEALAVQVVNRGGNPAVFDALAVMRELAGDTAGAEALHRQGVDHGRTGSMRSVAALRRAVGDTKGANDMYRRAIDRGDTSALQELAELWVAVGDSVGAGRLLRFGLTGDGEVATILDFASHGGLVGGTASRCPAGQRDSLPRQAGCGM